MPDWSYDDIEEGYIRIERQGIQDEVTWAAINGTDFLEGAKA